MKKRNPLKGLAAHEDKVAKKPVRAKASLKESAKAQPKEEKPKEKKTREKKTNHKSGEINMAEFKRQFKKDNAHLYS